MVTKFSPEETEGEIVKLLSRLRKKIPQSLIDDYKFLFLWMEKGKKKRLEGFTFYHDQRVIKSGDGLYRAPLTGIESAIFHILLRTLKEDRCIPQDLLHKEIFKNKTKKPKTSTLSVHLFNLNKKLYPVKIKAHTIRGLGIKLQRFDDEFFV